MEKFAFIIILVVLAIVVIGAILGKDKSKKLVDRIKDNGKKIQIPTVVPPVGNSKTPREPGGTIVYPNLYMDQLSADGKVFYRHEIFEKYMYESPEAIDRGEMIGIPVSRGNAACSGILLHGKKKMNGEYDTKHADTRNAMTVNEQAITIGVDDNGYYGAVSNPNAKVYKVVNNKAVRVNYNETFDIGDKTFILVNSQWLYFTLPEDAKLPDFMSVLSKEKNNDPSPIDIPGFAINSRDKMPQRKIIADTRVAPSDNLRGAPKSNTIKMRDNNEGTKPTMSYRLPLEEED